jgi:hypothetical protein
MELRRSQRVAEAGIDRTFRVFSKKFVEFLFTENRAMAL